MQFDSVRLVFTRSVCVYCLTAQIHVCIMESWMPNKIERNYKVGPGNRPNGPKLARPMIQWVQMGSGPGLKVTKLIMEAPFVLFGACLMETSYGPWDHLMSPVNSLILLFFLQVRFGWFEKAP